MKTIILSTLFLFTTTAAFGQTIENGIRIVCTCEVWKFMQIPPSRRNDMAYSIQPLCHLHKPIELSAPENYYIFKRKKKKTHFPNRKGTHIITHFSIFQE